MATSCGADLVGVFLESGKILERIRVVRFAGADQAGVEVACYKNAFMETCFDAIKSELDMTAYENYAAARREI